MLSSSELGFLALLMCTSVFRPLSQVISYMLQAIRLKVHNTRENLAVDDQSSKEGPQFVDYLIHLLEGIRHCLICYYWLHTFTICCCLNLGAVVPDCS